MGFGQYSTQGVARKSKRDMLASVILSPSVIHSSKMIARNTLEYTLASGERRIRLHDTDIFVQLPDGAIRLDTGGWNTKTTRDRFDIALKGTGLCVYTSNAVLYIMQAKDDSYWSGPADGTKPCAFNSVVTGRKHKTGWQFNSDIAAGTLSLDVLRPYIDRYMRQLKRAGIPLDSAGDPWVLTGKTTGKRSLSEAQDNGLYPADYVREWIGAGEEKEPYVFLTFIVAAFHFAGMTDFAISMYVRDFNAGRDKTIVCRRVRRYIRACLGFGIS